MKIEPKGENNAVVTMSLEEFERMSGLVQKMFDVINNDREGYQLKDLLLFFSFFVANAANFMAKAYKESYGEKVLSGEDFADLFAIQGKTFIRQFGNH